MPHPNANHVQPGQACRIYRVLLQMIFIPRYRFDGSRFARQADRHGEQGGRFDAGRQAAQDRPSTERFYQRPGALSFRWLGMGYGEIHDVDAKPWLKLGKPRLSCPTSRVARDVQIVSWQVSPSTRSALTTMARAPAPEYGAV